MSRRARQLHRALVPLVLLPLLITLITGVGFQIAVQTGNADEWEWLLALHRGDFAIVNLESVYVFYNGLSVLFLLASGTLLWLNSGRRNREN
ncbi:PepSY domain-containing protein [Oscillatoria sp. FACHB-1406]|nr:PepSY domain-containing protein [Oscillatoria sp. FACHB-1406]